MSATERAELSARIKDAQQRRAESKQTTAEPPASRGFPADLAAGTTMTSAEDVLHQIQAISKELHEANAACIERYAPGLGGFKTQLTLIGDPDVGTLIDATTPVVDHAGGPLSTKLDDCLREGFQSLALPPTTVGDQYTVTYSEDRSRPAS